MNQAGHDEISQAVDVELQVIILSSYTYKRHNIIHVLKQDQRHTLERYKPVDEFSVYSIHKDVQPKNAIVPM